MKYYYDLYSKDPKATNVKLENGVLSYIMEGGIPVRITREVYGNKIKFIIKEGDSISEFEIDKLSNKVFLDRKALTYTTNDSISINSSVSSPRLNSRTAWKQLGKPSYTTASAQRAIKDLNLNGILFIITVVFPQTAVTIGTCQIIRDFYRVRKSPRREIYIKSLLFQDRDAWYRFKEEEYYYYNSNYTGYITYDYRIRLEAN